MSDIRLGILDPWSGRRLDSVASTAIENSSGHGAIVLDQLFQQLMR